MNTVGKAGKLDELVKRLFCVCRLPWQPLLVGLLAFLTATGGYILRPSNLRWLMHDDRLTYLLGWMFFRNAPILQQPIGASWQNGMEISSSIVYPDGIPLMALLFKPFKFLLPDHFQYFGIWLLICFLLQAFFAWKILCKLTENTWHKVFATFFFVLAPPFIWRLSIHFALAAHWLLLASISLSLAERFLSRSWTLLIVVASLINPYLLAMTLLFYAAALARCLVIGELNLISILKSALLTAFLLGFVMWEAGYFMVSTVGTGGFGIYRSSLLTFFNPGVAGASGSLPWSHIIKNQPEAWGDREGFAYLGTGMILLSLAALFALLRRKDQSVKWSTTWPLCLVFCCSFVYALSNNIAIGSHVIFHYELPPFLQRVTSGLRASGRVIWPAYYLLITGILAIVLKRYRPHTAFILITGCALIQIVDSWKTIGSLRERYQGTWCMRTGTHPIELKGDFWEKVLKKYQKFVCVFPQGQPEAQDKPEDYSSLCFLAASHHLPINMGYLARVDEGKLKIAQSNLLRLIEQEQLDAHALYVFQNRVLWATATQRASARDFVGIVDGFNIVAPGWNSAFGQDPLVSLRDQLVTDHFPEYHQGSEIKFCTSGNGLSSLGGGWSDPESWGTWSDGRYASILLLMENKPISDSILLLNGRCFLNQKSPLQQFDVFVNGKAVCEITYSLHDPNGQRSITVPAALLSSRGRFVQIQFRFKSAVSLTDRGDINNVRETAFGIEKLAFQPVERAGSLDFAGDRRNE
jgi:uncharacterized protein DUF6311